MLKAQLNMGFAFGRCPTLLRSEFDDALYMRTIFALSLLVSLDILLFP